MSEKLEQLAIDAISCFTCHQPRVLAMAARTSRPGFPPPGSHVYRALLAAAAAFGRALGVGPRSSPLTRRRRGFDFG